MYWSERATVDRQFHSERDRGKKERKRAVFLSLTHSFRVFVCYLCCAQILTLTPFSSPSTVAFSCRWFVVKIFPLSLSILYSLFCVCVSVSDGAVSLERAGRVSAGFFFQRRSAARFAVGRSEEKSRDRDRKKASEGATPFHWSAAPSRAREGSLVRGRMSRSSCCLRRRPKIVSVSIFPDGHSLVHYSSLTTTLDKTRQRQDTLRSLREEK